MLHTEVSSGIEVPIERWLYSFSNSGFYIFQNILVDEQDADGNKVDVYLLAKDLTKEEKEFLE